MSTLSHTHLAAFPHWLRSSVWFVGVAAVAFLIPFVGVSVLDLQHDVFYLVYFATTAALLVAYVRTEHVDLPHILRGRGASGSAS